MTSINTRERQFSLKVDPFAEVDTGGTLKIHVAATSAPLHMSTRERTVMRDPDQIVQPGETVTVTTRTFLYSPGRARLRILETIPGSADV